MQKKKKRLLKRPTCPCCPRLGDCVCGVYILSVNCLDVFLRNIFRSLPKKNKKTKCTLLARPNQLEIMRIYKYILLFYTFNVYMKINQVLLLNQFLHLPTENLSDVSNKTRSKCSSDKYIFTFGRTQGQHRPDRYSPSRFPQLLYNTPSQQRQVAALLRHRSRVAAAAAAEVSPSS